MSASHLWLDGHRLVRSAPHPMAISRVGGDWPYMVVSPAWAELYREASGLETADQWEGVSHFVALEPVPRPEWEAVRARLAEGRAQHDVLDYVDAGGHRHRIAWSSLPTRGFGGHRYCVAYTLPLDGMLSDLLAEVDALARRVAEMADMAAAINAMVPAYPRPVLWADHQGGTHGNPAMVRLLGLPAGSAITEEAILAAIHPDDAARSAEEANRIVGRIQAGEIDSGEVSNRYRRGSGWVRMRWEVRLARPGLMVWRGDEVDDG